MDGLPYRDRVDAGQRLAEALTSYADVPDVLVLGLPRGGVPVAFEVARTLGADFDVFVVRKLGVPGQEELAMGAIASGGIQVLNDDVVDMLRLPQEVIDRVAEKERAELERREVLYRGDRPPLNATGRTIILVDDGLATGSTMRAAVASIRAQSPSRLIVAVPVAAAETCEMLRSEVDEIVCLATPEPFQAVGLWYGDFSQTTDAEVRDLLERSGNRRLLRSRQ